MHAGAFNNLGHRVIILALLVLGIWGGVDVARRQWLQDEATLNFSIYAAIEVDGSVYSGSAVWQTRTWSVKFPSSAGTYAEVRGEAIALDGGARNLFLLKKPSSGGSGLSYANFPMDCYPDGLPPETDIIAWLRNSFTGPCNVLHDADRLPALVEIADLSRPETVRQITYNVPGGDGLCQTPCLKTLRVERTNSFLTTGIEDIIPKLAGYKYGLTDIETGNIRLSGPMALSRFTLIDFSTEIGSGEMIDR